MPTCHAAATPAFIADRAQDAQCLDDLELNSTLLGLSLFISETDILVGEWAEASKYCGLKQIGSLFLSDIEESRVKCAAPSWWGDCAILNMQILLVSPAWLLRFLPLPSQEERELGRGSTCAVVWKA